MFFKSLRWRLQVWHAVVLLIVLSSFGAIVHRLHWQTRLQQVDAELNRTVGVVMWQLRRLLPRPPGGRRPRGREDGKPDEPAQRSDQNPHPDQNLATQSNRPHTEADANASSNPPLSPRDRPPSDAGPLPTEFEQLFQGDEDSRFYFAIWNDKGELLVKSESAPEIPFPNLQIGREGVPNRLTRERQGDHVYREVIHAGMFRDVRNLLVGRSLEKVIANHHQSGLLLAAMGLVILAAGTLGGGWLSARAIRPITAMTVAAESISAQNLSERINVEETDSELGNLAKVLNKTFDRLQLAFERQQQFTADASHELRTPLSVIATHTELALARPRSNDEYRLAIETCQRASQRMRSLIDALLVLARFDAEASRLKRYSVALESVALDCAELVRPLALERGIQIECLTSPCEVLGDWDRLSQVFTNLLTNAIRYNVDGGQVQLTTRVAGGKAIVTVVDTGIGIAADQLPRIFDRFYQVDKVRSRSEGSCGLGLAICKTIVEAHGGTISVKSQLDVGTTIEVQLPVVGQSMASDESIANDERLVSARSDS